MRSASPTRNWCALAHSWSRAGCADCMPLWRRGDASGPAPAPAPAHARGPQLHEGARGDGGGLRHGRGEQTTWRHTGATDENGHGHARIYDRRGVRATRGTACLWRCVAMLPPILAPAVTFPQFCQLNLANAVVPLLCSVDGSSNERLLPPSTSITKSLPHSLCTFPDGPPPASAEP
ncbi:hypothetical protein B0H15DRAFT_840670 [Mycena belliarum]|uniref:Uncharacterized protein n=1 Tax=Mycena belliarum TaxID=1033014 RepID=A0AAD6XUL8_9AGAR|nr:hypothetical protein B0H15DRAFT_840670 [Mycena belliae]